MISIGPISRLRGPRTLKQFQFRRSEPRTLVRAEPRDPETSFNFTLLEGPVVRFWDELYDVRYEKRINDQ